MARIARPPTTNRTATRTRRARALRLFALVAATGALLLPGGAGIAESSDTDLFRVDVPPNILLLVDNSSSMRRQVWHPSYGIPLANGDHAKTQTECTFFHDIHSGSLDTRFDPKRATFKDVNGNNLKYRGNPNAWETIPILDPYGVPLYDDIDEDGVQDAGEDTYYYRFPDPSQSDADWLDDTNNEQTPIVDYHGNHLMYDVDGDGNLEPADGDRMLYYGINNSGNPQGSNARIWYRIKPWNKATEAGIHYQTLELLQPVCGFNTAGYSLFAGDDPTAVSNDGTAIKFETEYLDWLFSSYGATARPLVFFPSSDPTNAIRNKAACITLQAGEPATYEVFRRSRIQSLTLILRTVICQVNQVGNVRFGFAQFRFHGKGGDDNGGYVAVPVEDWFDSSGNPNVYTLHGITDSHENHLRRTILNTTPDAQTPLSEALFQIYTYFMPRTAADMPEGRDWQGVENGYKFPVYNYDMSLYDPLANYDDEVDPFPPNLADIGGRFVGVDPASTTEDASSLAAPDPIQWSCQKNFVLLITDGFSAGDDFTDNDDKINAHFNPVPPIETNTDRGFADFLNLIGDHYRIDDGTAGGAADEDETPSGTKTAYLDDIALFMNRFDMRPDMANDQTIDLYTVGYSVESDPSAGAAATNVEVAALRGNGTYFESSDADQLSDDIVDAITEMIEKAQSFTSATVPASRTTDGNNFYSSFFLPKDDSPFWEGHLKNFNFTGTGDILTADGYCATGTNPTSLPPCASGGQLRTFASAFWDAAEAMPLPANRKLFVEYGNRSIFSQPLEWNDTNVSALDLGIVAAVDALSEPFASLADQSDDGIRDEVVREFRGCEALTNCTPRANDAGAQAMLGDIFHSNPIVVGSPNSPINEGSYKSFATSHRTRHRVIYAGSNDGFLHGFHAGKWETLDAGGNPLVPPRHNRGTGEELMAFMPYSVRNIAKEFVKELSFPRAFETVDGSPAVADVWFYRTVSGSDLTSVDPSLVVKSPVQWRTVLISGLRGGGGQYFALDVTDPPEFASTVTTTYPRYLWGFPCEKCLDANTVNGSTAVDATWMGFTASDPIITRVRVKDDTDSNPAGFERWVAIFGAGYHPHGDPNGSDYKEPGDAGYTPLGRGIYMVDITTGEVLAKKVFDPLASALDSTTPTVGVKELQYAVPSSPAVFDLDFDGFADVIYIGDLGGNVWKWVVGAVGDDPINNSSNNSLAQPNWPFRKFVRAGTSLEPVLAPEQRSPAVAYDGTVHYQSFFFPPTGVLRSGKLVLAFGAGERANPKGADAEWGDGDDTNNNHFYVVKDSDPYERNGSIPAAITGAFDEADLADFSASVPLTCAVMKSTKEGYFITARDAEKFITNSVIFLGDVFTASFLPPDPMSTDRCDVSGDAFLYRFDLECGVGKYPDGNGNPENDRRRAIGDGLPTRPRVSVGDINQGGGGGGCNNRVVVITSDGNIENECPGPMPSSGINIRSWRER